MKKIRVMHVLNTGKFSGAESVVISLINVLKSRVDSIYVSLNGEIASILEENNIEFYPVKKLSYHNLKEAIDTIRPDIIQAHDYTASIVVSSLTSKLPIISHLHNNSLWISRLSLKSIAFGITSLRVKKILTVSDSIMNEFIFGKYFLNKSKVVGNPFDMSKIISLSQRGVPNSAWDIVFLGRLSEQKNPELFIEIIKELVQTFPALKVLMIGDGELKLKISQLIDGYKLQSNIELIGFKKNPYAYLGRSRILCMPSLWEGFGLAALEALSLGLPVVSSYAGGLNDIVTNDCGNKCQSKQEYVEAISQLLIDERLYQSKSIAAVHRAHEYDNLEDYSGEMLAIYRELVD